MNGSTVRERPVVVGIDGSDEAVAAVRWAASYAALVHAPLWLVHTVPGGDWYGSAAFVDGGALENELHRLGQQYLARAEVTARAVSLDLCVESFSVDGTFASFASTTPAELVVLGAKKSGYTRDVVLGSSIIRVVNHAQGPVLVWREGADPGNDRRPVVVGVDGSEQSNRAFELGMEMAQTLGRRLIAANYWGLAAEAVSAIGAGYIDWVKVRADEERWLRTYVAPMREKYPDVILSTVSAESTPSRGLRALSSSAWIVAVGSRGRGALRSVALGSVSQNLVHHSECAVLIVR
ncbi:universal stress protein [Rhodococcoides yunnanense]|uniref:universal stress protein n=1 Tax=Rhodococcoides yunnanense TaxID=278209 RepID=UPI000932A2DA|nr:universal stress protein [Rhodococcus yunnanensis]